MGIEIGDLPDRLAICAQRLAPPTSSESTVDGWDIVADLKLAANLLRYLVAAG
jgi:hypothetical protein